MGLDQASTVQQAVGSSAGGGSGGMPTLRHAALHSASVRTRQVCSGSPPPPLVRGRHCMQRWWSCASPQPCMPLLTDWGGFSPNLLMSLRRPKGPQGHQCPSGLLPQRAAGRCQPPTQ